MLQMGQTFPKEVRVAFVNSSFFSVFGSTTGDLVPSSLEGVILILLSQAIGFKYKLVQAMDGEWGYKASDGNWTGAVGLIYRNEADISVNFLSITSERMEAVDFSEPYLETGLTFITNLPEMLPRMYLYLYPFSAPTWICVLATLFGLPFAMSKLQDARWFVFERFWMIYAAMVRQPVCSGELKYKLFVGFSWIVMSVISMSYAAVILSFLTVPLFEKPLTNFEDLYKAVMRGEYVVLSFRGNSYLQLLNEMKTDHLRSIARMIQKNEWYKDSSTWNQEFGHRKHAELGPRFEYAGVYGRPPMSSMYIAEEDAIPDRIAVAVNKNFCCIDVLNTAIRRVNHAGIYKKLQSKIEYESWIKTYHTRSVEHQIAMEDLSGAIYVLLIGYTVSLMVFFGEVIITFGKRTGYFKQFDWL